MFLRALAVVVAPVVLYAQATKAPTAAPAGKLAPRLTVDYQWPRPLPANKLLGSVTGLAVDSHDHVFVVHNVNSFTTRTETGADQTPPIAACCFSEQPIIQFDAAGSRVKSWGGPGPGYEWPSLPAGIAIAPNGNVWITGAGGLDGQVLVFSHDGAFIRQIGKAGQAPGAAPAGGRGAADTAYQGVSPGARGGAAAAPGGVGGAAGGGGGGRAGRGGRGGAAPSLPPNNASTELFGGAMRVSFSADGKTAFIADGLRNRRVVEVDAETGAIRKFWGANGGTPSDASMPAYSPSAPPSSQFSGVTCAEPSKDGMLYVCDRANNRVQVFKLDGSFVKEAKVAGNTLGEGSVWDIAFSADAAQRFIYVADGVSHRVRILDRATLTELTNFGEGGRVPGQFYNVGSIAVDSKGNVFTGEGLEGKRVQKFVYGGLAPVTKAAQGVLWPVRAAR
jgi:DNA-binding beta-propeller fold protein YncE